MFSVATSYHGEIDDQYHPLRQKRQLLHNQSILHDNKTEGSSTTESIVISTATATDEDIKGIQILYR